jgi:hypothetical protein
MKVEKTFSRVPSIFCTIYSKSSQLLEVEQLFINPLVREMRLISLDLLRVS